MENGGNQTKEIHEGNDIDTEIAGEKVGAPASPSPPTQASTTHGPTDDDEEFSTYSIAQRRWIVLSASFACFFSPLATNIYLPALNAIAADLGVSPSLINLTVTTYLIFQGIAPTFTGGFSDIAGRRPACVICFIIFFAANLGLALQTNYAALMVLRALQSAGSSGLVAISYGIVADIVPSSERGSYIAYTSLPSILGPSVAPTAGGLISQFLGWRWIFWLLLILGSAYLVGFIMFFPETCREIVGNGSKQLPLVNMTLLQIMRRSKAKRQSEEREQTQEHRRWRFPNPLNVLVIFLDKEAAIILISVCLLYMCYSATWSGIPTQFEAVYGFNDLKIGLVYLPFAAGSIVSAFSTGKLIDFNYRRHAKRTGFPLTKNRGQDLTNFPIERARLEIGVPLFYATAATIITFGWVLEFQTSIAGPLVLLFLVGYFVVAASNIMNILMVDLFSRRAATATAATNLIRCVLAAVAVSVIVPMINVMGRGWAYTLLCLLWILSSVSLFAMIKLGPGWRKARKEQEETRRKEKERERHKETNEEARVV